MSQWTNSNTMVIGTGFPHTNEFIDFLRKEEIEGAVISSGEKETIYFRDPTLRAMIEMLEDGFHSGTTMELAVGEYRAIFAKDEIEEDMEEKLEKFAVNLMSQNFKDLLLIPRLMETKTTKECKGHPAGPNDPMGQTVYCDGSCKGGEQ